MNTWSTGVGNPNLHMDALEGGSISRACSKLGIICVIRTKMFRKCTFLEDEEKIVIGYITIYRVYYVVKLFNFVNQKYSLIY